MALREHRGSEPVRGRAAAIEQSGGGENERASADGGNAGAVGGGVPQCVDDVGRDCGGGVGAARQDNRVRIAECFQSPGRLEGERSGVDGRVAPQIRTR